MEIQGYEVRANKAPLMLMSIQGYIYFEQINQFPQVVPRGKHELSCRIDIINLTTVKSS